MKSSIHIKLAILLFAFSTLCNQLMAQGGTWTPLNNLPPDTNVGVMLLLTDGTVLCKTNAGGGDGYGNTWNRLTPDSNGSYINGTWSTIAPMWGTCLYFSSQVLRDGRVFVAGGEYGSGQASAEMYDPLTDKWTFLSYPQYLGDANSELLPDGKVLEAIVDNTEGGDSAIIFDPATNTWGARSVCIGRHLETSWLMLADNSILFVDWQTRNSERYIPALNKWVVDSTVPDSIYDPVAEEAGPALLLPDGRGFFTGASGHTALYTPSGNISPGKWAAGPDVPKNFSTADAPGAMMPNGKILFTASPKPYGANYFPSPTSFFEYDYTKDTIYEVSAPYAPDTIQIPCFFTNLLDLPDGNVLYGEQYSPYYYVYTPVGKPLSAGKPTINNITKNGCDFTITGTLFNGISQGGDYGDDFQMFSNYPIVRMKKGNKVYYARTFNWNRIAVQTGALLDTATFTVPWTVPAGTYWLVVVANGISSDSVSFVYNPCNLGIKPIDTYSNNINIYPNPAHQQATVNFKVEEAGDYLISVTDMLGRTLLQETGKASAGTNTHLLHIESLVAGMYVVSLQQGKQVLKTKLVVN